jgi:glutathione S-transferase
VADNKGQLKIWGRANSVNVQKVLWCLAEFDLAYERIDAGMAFGRNTEPDYLAMNPNARVPTLVDGDYVLWESNSVMRYLAMSYRPESPLYPQAPKQRAGVDRWLDWTLSTVQPVDRPVFWGLVRPSAGQRDMVAIQRDVDAEAKVWLIADERLATHRFFEGDVLHAGRYCDRRLREALARVRRCHQAEAGASRTLVRADLGAPRISAIRGSADVMTAARGDRGRSLGQREPPTSTLTAPPTFTQVSVPSTFLKPGP